MTDTAIQKAVAAPLFKVTLLLSRYNDAFSKMIALSSRGKFTHISISLDPAEDVFYSFNKKGFIEEHWHGKRSRHLLPDRAYMRFYVTKEQFERLAEEINLYKKRSAELSYSVIGTLLCMIRIPSRFKKQFFCSQFVADVLRRSGTVKLKRKSSLYLPMHLLKELRGYAAEA